MLADTKSLATRLSMGQSGSINGAIESGERAAREVLQSTRAEA